MVRGSLTNLPSLFWQVTCQYLEPRDHKNLNKLGGTVEDGVVAYYSCKELNIYVRESNDDRGLPLEPFSQRIGICTDDTLEKIDVWHLYRKVVFYTNCFHIDQSTFQKIKTAFASSSSTLASMDLKVESTYYEGKAFLECLEINPWNWARFLQACTADNINISLEIELCIFVDISDEDRLITCPDSDPRYRHLTKLNTINLIRNFNLLPVLLAKFPNLEHLEIRLTCLNAALLNILAEKAKKLKVIKVYLYADQWVLAPPDEESMSAWKTERDACPDLRVSCMMEYPFAFSDDSLKVVLDRLFHPSTPLSHVSLQLDEPSAQKVLEACNDHTDTLRCVDLTVYCESGTWSSDMRVVIGKFKKANPHFTVSLLKEDGDCYTLIMYT